MYYPLVVCCLVVLILGEEKGKKTRFKTPQEKMRILLRNLVQEVKKTEAVTGRG